MLISNDFVYALHTILQVFENIFNLLIIFLVKL